MKRFFETLQADAAETAANVAFDGRQLAAAALLVHAAGVDNAFDESERARIVDIARTRLGLPADEAAALIDAAERRVENSVQILGFTRTIKDRFSYEQRVELIEMLWEVVYADGRVDEFESQLMRRIAGLIYVTDRDAGEARRRVRERQ